MPDLWGQKVSQQPILRSNNSSLVVVQTLKGWTSDDA
jgi:hypothetical protein